MISRLVMNVLMLVGLSTPAWVGPDNLDRWIKRKHKRGVRDNDVSVNVGEQGYRCRRCLATWVRKSKSKHSTVKE